jgi:NAD(P)-dependent dehydrogenase (short-subunit alcohol dehydrogenase family)
MSERLKGKIAVVTGGSAGIGLGVAKAFADQGAQVFVTGRRQSELDKAVADIGGGAIGIQADSAKIVDLGRIFATVKEKAGRIDVLFANAGIFEFSPLGEITEEHFDKTFGINVRGLLFTVQGALPLMMEKSSIILTGSIAGSKGIPAMSVYAASKAAIRSFARGWMLDLKPRGIRVNVLSPGHTETPGFNSALPEEAKAGIIAAIPSSRLGMPADMAKAAVFLASADGDYVNGIELVVDGGVSQY